MRTITTLHPHIQVDDELASNPVTTVAHHGGYDLIISTEIAAWAFSLESTYLGSERAGNSGTHLTLARAGHRLEQPTRIEPVTSRWWPSALLDHYAVLQDQLGAGARVALSDGEILSLH